MEVVNIINEAGNDKKWYIPVNINKIWNKIY